MKEYSVLLMLAIWLFFFCVFGIFKVNKIQFYMSLSLVEFIEWWFDLEIIKMILILQMKVIDLLSGWQIYHRN